MTQQRTSEQWSAWIDGERADAAPSEAGGREACAVWWLIGDVMRREVLLSPDFSARVMQSLEAEPTVLAPRSPVVVRAASMPRWMPVAAAVAGVALVAWAVLGGRAEQGQAVKALTVARALPQGATGLSLASREPNRDQEETRAYLLAHQAHLRGSQVAGVSSHVRPVSFEPGLAAAR